MLKLADRVKETTITQGSGLYVVLNGAIQAFQPFSTTIGDGNSTYYTIENNNQFEVGIGTYRASDNTLARTTVLNSSNSNQRIVLDSVSIIFCTYPASQAAFLENGYIKSLSPQYSGIIFPDQTVLTSASTLQLPSGLVYTNDARLSDSRAPLSHSHVITDVSGLQTALNLKQPSGLYANLVHTHVISDVTGLQSSLDNKQPSGNYANSSHTHIASQITDFGSAVSGYAPPTTNASLLTTGTLSDNLLSANVVRTNDSRLSDARTPLEHTHTSSNITDFNTSVSGLFSVKNVAGSGYVNVASTTGNYIVYVTGLQPSGNYASSVHSHVVSDVTGLQTALDSKQQSGSYATAVHVHAISDVTNLQSTLDGKQASGSYAALSHTHTSSNITDFNSSVSGLLPVKNVVGTGYVNVVPTTGNYTISVTGLQPSGNYASSVHSHIISDVTGLQSALDLKAPLANPTFTGTVNGISKSMVGLGNVDNTSDANKPISTATQTALDNKAASSHTHTASNITDFNTSVSGLVNGIYAPLSSPTLTGVPLAPTASSGTNTNQIASTSFVRTEISNLVSSAPSTLDTLNELATALGNDPNFATTVTNNLASKAALSGATFTGSISSPSGSFTQSLKVNGTNVSVVGHNHIIGDVTGLQTALDGKQTSGSYAPLVHTHVISDVTGLQSALDLKQPSGSYAASLHTHTASQITDFNSSVSGLLPVKNITASSYVNIVPATGNYTISVTGLQPAGSYASSVHSHVISDVTGLQTALDNKQASGSYAALVHTHAISDVTGLQSALDLKQPSGSYAASSHTHASSQITDFNTSVSGLVNGIYAPLSSPTFTGTVNGISKSMVGLGNVDNTSDANKPVSTATQTALDGKAALSHTHTSSNITDFANSVSGLLPVKNITPSSYVNIVSSTGNFTISVTGLQPSGNYAASSHTHISSEITNFNGSVSGLLPVTNILAGTNITVSSASGSFTINSTASGGGSSSIDAGTYPLITISSQPSGTTVASSSNATFSVTATASSPTSSIAYQWQESTNNSTWTDISGSTSSTLTLASVQSNKNGYYYKCNLQSLLSNIYSSSAVLTVASSTKLTISRSNGTSTFTGNGAAGNPFFRAAGYNQGDADGLDKYSLTVLAAGTLVVTATYGDGDNDSNSWYARKNGGGYFGIGHVPGTITQSASVAAGDVITFTATGTNGQNFSNVSIYVS